MVKQYCSVCERPRDGHPQPFGSRGQLEPLSPDELDRVRAERAAEAQKEQKGSAKASGSKDKGNDNGKDNITSDDESGDEEFADLDNSGDLDEEIKRLEGERKALEDKEKQRVKDLEAQKKVNAKKEKKG